MWLAEKTDGEQVFLINLGEERWLAPFVQANPLHRRSTLSAMECPSRPTPLLPNDWHYLNEDNPRPRDTVSTSMAQVAPKSHPSRCY